ncbi:LBF_1134 family protein [Leptospira ognonensis]|uniref:LBF_1134 family protein n=1 Tax=Leptospira ognonensis TaxID=2484945 RepID=UPI001AF01383|nr:hypothetical protein [Leptospira ognonensis]
MRNFFFLISVTALISFCAGGNLKVKVKSDLSGEMQIYEKKMKRKSGGIFFGSGLKAEYESELLIKERFYTFQNITKISPPGLRFLQYQEENDTAHSFMVVIDTSNKSKLIEALGIKKEEIQNLISEAKSRDDLMRFNTLSEHIQIELYLPYQIKAIKFTEHRTPGEWTARSEGNGKVVINIPLYSCWENEYPLTEIQITYKD